MPESCGLAVTPLLVLLVALILVCVLSAPRAAPARPPRALPPCPHPQSGTCANASLADIERFRFRPEARGV